MDVVNVVELIDQIAVVICALIPLPSCLVGHSIDLCGVHTAQQYSLIMNPILITLNGRQHENGCTDSGMGIELDYSKDFGLSHVYSMHTILDDRGVVPLV